MIRSFITLNLFFFITMSSTSYAQTPDIFPQIETRSLAGDTVVFPDSLHGQRTFLVLAFESMGRYRKAATEANNWYTTWENELQQEGIAFYEIAMMSSGWKAVSKWADNGMRAGLPVAKHPYVTTYYGKKRAYKRMLNIDDLMEAHVYFLDEQGNIVAYASGAPEARSLMLSYMKCAAFWLLQLNNSVMQGVFYTSCIFGGSNIQ